MGFLRSLYGVIGWDYVGSAERKVIEKQAWRRQLVLHDIRKIGEIKNAPSQKSSTPIHIKKKPQNKKPTQSSFSVDSPITDHERPPLSLNMWLRGPPIL